MSTNNNNNNNYSAREKAEILDAFYAETRKKIREHNGMLSTSQATKLVMEELPQRLEEALSEAEQDFPLLVRRLREKRRIERSDIDAIDEELAKVLKKIYREHGELGFEVLIQRYHNGNRDELGEILHALEKKGIDVRRS